MFVSATVIFIFLLSSVLFIECDNVHGCPYEKELEPCFCEPLAGFDEGNFAILCTDTSVEKVRNVLEFVNTTEFEDKVTHFVAENLTAINNELTGNIFHFVTRVRSISLTKSNIERIGKKVFFPYTFYEYINLSFNNLLSIPENWYLTASHVNLSNNLLSVIPSRSFLKFKSIDFSNNRLKWIREDAFKFEGYDNVKVDLSNNLLTDASFEKNFMPSHSVELQLGRNNLTYFDEDIFEGVRKIYALNNPLACDCRMRWMVHDMYFPFLGQCPDGNDFVSSYIAGKVPGVQDCANSLSLDAEFDKDFFSPCHLAPGLTTTNWTIRCYMTNYEKIDASLSRLRSVFTHPIRLYQLEVTSMNFDLASTHIPANFLNFIQFEKISLTSSAITSVDADAFYASARTALEIDLSSNKLRDGVLEFVSKFLRLKKINLANNKLQTIPSGLFQRLNHIRQIDLSGNQLQLIQSNAFYFAHKDHSFHSIQINLSRNQLTSTSFEPDFIEHRRTLAVNLILKQNQLSCLRKKTFEPFLDFERNHVDVDFKSDANSRGRLAAFCDLDDE